MASQSLSIILLYYTIYGCDTKQRSLLSDFFSSDWPVLFIYLLQYETQGAIVEDTNTCSLCTFLDHL